MHQRRHSSPDKTDQANADRSDQSLGRQADRSAEPSPSIRRARPRTIANRPDPSPHRADSRTTPPPPKRARKHAAPASSRPKQRKQFRPSAPPHHGPLPDIATPFAALTHTLNQIRTTAESIHQLFISASSEISALKHLSLDQTAALLSASTRQVQYWAADPDCVLKAADFDRRPRFGLQNIREFVISRQFKRRIPHSASR